MNSCRGRFSFKFEPKKILAGFILLSGLFFQFPVRAGMTHSSPVQLLFSSHASTADADWALRRINHLLRHQETQQPLALWLENAYPAGLPDTVQELKNHFPDHSIFQSVNLYQEILQESLNPEVLEFLKSVFEQACEKEINPAPSFQSTRHPFFRRLEKGARQLRRKGWVLEIKTEKPSFEAYLYDLRRDAMGVLASYWLGRHQKKNALASFDYAYRFLSEFLRIRDEKLGSEIKRAYQNRPETIHIVIRGLAHQLGTSRYFSKHQIPFESAIQRPGFLLAYWARHLNIHQYLYRYRALPSLRQPAGFAFLAQQLFKSVR